MKRKFFAERGQALILIALAGITLFGIAGLAIDGSAKYSDRRHAQNAADTAALAGALTLARGGADSACSTASGYTNSASCLDIIDAAWDRAEKNGYDGMLSSDVEVYSPPVSGTFSVCNDVHFDCKDYVQVIVTSHVDTWFMRVLGFQQTTNIVQAVASKLSENSAFNFGGNAVVALSPEGCALMGQGSIKLVVDGGGLYSNSDDPSCSFQGGTCASVVDINNEDGDPGAITMVGGYNAGKGCLPDATMLPAGSKQLPFPPPYQEIAPPVECTQTKDLASNISFDNSTGTATLQPGHYSNLPASNKWKKMILNPGVYCVDNSIDRNSKETMVVSGTFGVDPGVFLYIQSGGSFTFNGGSGTQIWGISDPNSPYFGYVLYVAPNYYNGSPAICKINGHSGDPSTGELPDKFQGTIYAPYCSLTISGTSDSTGWESQLIAYEVKFSGGANIHLTYNDDNTPSWHIPLQVGLSR